MFLADITESKMERWTSTDGINFVYQEDVITNVSWGGNPFIWFNPNDNMWYLYHYDKVGTTEYIKVRWHTNIEDLDTVSSSVVMSKDGVVSSPSLMYRDGYYWLIVEVLETVWKIRAFYSTSPTSGFVECSNSPILTNDEACGMHFLSPDGSKAYLFSNRDSANWYQDTREIYSKYDGENVELGTHCRMDFGDVRFTASDGVTPLDYWIEENVDGDYAVFWVKVADDLSTNPATIYVYYGNPSATTTSNGDATFIFFDDFESSLDWTNKWQSTDQSKYSVEDGKLKFLTPASSSQLLNSKNAFNGFAAQCLIRRSVAGTQAYFDFEPNVASYTGNDCGILNVGYLRAFVGGAQNYVYEYPDDTATYYKMIYKCPASGNANLQIYKASILKVERTATPSERTVYLSFLSWISSGIGYADDVFVRKYVDPEPSHGAWGSEEVAVAQYQITFDQSGIGSDFAGTVVTIDTTPYTRSALPISLWWNEGSTHNFAFASPLMVNSGKRYVWTSTTGLSSHQSDTLTITISGSVTGHYKTQYYLTVRTDPPGITTILGEDWYDASSVVSLNAPQVLGYTFLNWDVDGFSQGAGIATISIPMNAPHIVTAHYQAIPASASVQTATGTGTATFNSSAGYIEDLTAISETTLPITGKPSIIFPHGFFSFKVKGLSNGQTITITITLPSNAPVGTQFWKYQNGRGWYQIPISDDDGDNIIIIMLTDGGIGDADGTANGVIVDPGGPGIPLPVGGLWLPINKTQLLAPWIGVASLITFITAISTIVSVKRKKKHQN
jgi:hypothetical protein